MSTEAYTWAMDHAPMLMTAAGKADATARHVLQVLAEHARPDGTEARPSVLRLSYRTGLDRRTVQRALRRLETGQLITRDGSVQGVTRWRLAMHLRRPAEDWDRLVAEQDAEREAAAERQREARARRAIKEALAKAEDTPVTHSDSVTVTHSDGVTGGGVTHSAPPEPSVTASRTSTPAGRRPSTGSRGLADSGSAAAAKTTQHQPTRPGEAAAIRAVITALPPALTALLPDPLPGLLTETIAAELRRGLTPQQITARADRRWHDHRLSLEADTAGGGTGLHSPVGAAHSMLKPGDCTHPRCADGTDLDTGETCRACVRAAQDRAAAASAPAPPVPLRAVPATGTGRPSPHQQRPLLLPIASPAPPPDRHQVPPAAGQEATAPPATCASCHAPYVPRVRRPDTGYCSRPSCRAAAQATGT